MRGLVADAQPEIADPENSVTETEAKALSFGEQTHTLRQLKLANLREPEKAVEDILSEGETIALVAKPKTGKTRLAQQLAVAVAQGPPANFLGQAIGVKKSVLYIDLESKPYFVRDRFEKIAGNDWESIQDEIHIYCVPSLAKSNVNLTNDGLKEMMEFLELTKAGFFIIDTLRLVYQVKENEAESVVKNLRRLDELRSVNPELAILVLHHLRKSGTDTSLRTKLRDDPQSWLENTSGSHAFVAHTDGAMGMEKETSGPETRYIFTGIRRNGPTPSLLLKSDEETLRFEPVEYLERISHMVFTPTESALWNKLPEQFTWSEAMEIAGGESKKSLLNSKFGRAIEHKLLEKLERGSYVKTRHP